ncbi:hypothetical protein OROMI_020028 [Orobanche minor]
MSEEYDSTCESLSNFEESSFNAGSEEPSLVLDTVVPETPPELQICLKSEEGYVSDTESQEYDLRLPVTRSDRRRRPKRKRETVGNVGFVGQSVVKVPLSDALKQIISIYCPKYNWEIEEVAEELVDWSKCQH